MNDRPLLLDLYCGAGGAARGYQMAGFKVVGVDNQPQKRYCGDVFVQADALEYLRNNHHLYTAFHASPPCQGYILAGIADKHKHFKLIEPTRDLLLEIGKPYVIENVMDAPLRDPVVLNGLIFDLMVLRDRKFETNWPLPQPALPPFTGKVTKMGRKPAPGEYICVTGHFTDVQYARTAMGISWMTRDELAQAIPPAYTHYIGEHLRVHLQRKQQPLQKLFRRMHDLTSMPEYRRLVLGAPWQGE